ncbi:MAG: tRNA pseudouridine(55) synthase TruB, partial [Rudaea sp.]
ESALAGLRGRIVQVPPAYSAIKRGGVALYKRARRGEDVLAPPREVEVHRLELENRDGDILYLRVECGSGTYVRSLARDLGERLGCGAHLIALRREWVEPFREQVMHTLDELERVSAAGGTAALDRLLLPLAAGVGALPALHLDAEQARRLRFGQRFAMPDWGPIPLCRGLDGQGRLVALVRLDPDGTVAIVRGFAAAE